MPTMSQFLLRAALIWLAIGAFLGMLILTSKAGLLPGQFLGLRGIHGQIMLLGWMLQAAIGTAIWIFPRISSPQIPRAWRVASAGAWALNIGIACALVAQVFASNQIVYRVLALLAALLELIAGPLLVSQIWARTNSINTLHESVRH
ncbi:MAG: cbb3-type cytochrome c oxidase subunit I [Roseiflexaceae bacterium]|nr:cbb3-type cytochrome c oxidase subunit I [Roseiflexaceae bacterium]